MKIEVGKKYIVTDKPKKIESKFFQYLLGEVVEITGELDELDRYPVKIFCEVPKGQFPARYILPDMLAKEHKE